MVMTTDQLSAAWILSCSCLAFQADRRKRWP